MFPLIHTISISQGFKHKCCHALYLRCSGHIHATGYSGTTRACDIIATSVCSRRIDRRRTRTLPTPPISPDKHTRARVLLQHQHRQCAHKQPQRPRAREEAPEAVACDLLVCVFDMAELAEVAAAAAAAAVAAAAVPGQLAPPGACPPGLTLRPAAASELRLCAAAPATAAYAAAVPAAAGGGGAWGCLRAAAAAAARSPRTTGAESAGRLGSVLRRGLGGDSQIYEREVRAQGKADASASEGRSNDAEGGAEHDARTRSACPLTPNACERNDGSGVGTCAPGGWAARRTAAEGPWTRSSRCGADQALRHAELHAYTPARARTHARPIVSRMRGQRHLHTQIRKRRRLKNVSGRKREPRARGRWRRSRK
jgi:hypothetical protein